MPRQTLAGCHTVLLVVPARRLSSGCPHTSHGSWQPATAEGDGQGDPLNRECIFCPLAKVLKTLTEGEGGETEEAYLTAKEGKSV